MLKRRAATRQLSPKDLRRHAIGPGHSITFCNDAHSRHFTRPRCQGGGATRSPTIRAGGSLEISPSRPLPYPITTSSLIAYIDYITDPEISFACFYVFPVLLAAWFQGRTIGYVMAAVSAGAWLLTQRMAPPSANEHPPAVAYAYWNTLIMFCFFVAAVMLLSDFEEPEHAAGGPGGRERTTTLRRLASQLSEAENSERRRLAYDIHDGFGQILSLLKLNLAATPPPNARRQPAAPANCRRPGNGQRSDRPFANAHLRPASGHARSPRPGADVADFRRAVWSPPMWKS